jgi:hypothetical protein
MDVMKQVRRDGDIGCSYACYIYKTPAEMT